MTFKTDLDQAYQKYLAQVSERLNFEIYETYNQGMGALIKLKNKDLKIQLLNDRGIINFEIGSNYGRELFFDSELIALMIRLDQTDQENLSKMRRKQINNNRLGLNQQVELLKTVYLTLKEIFSELNYKKTIKKLNKIGGERFENMM